MRAFGADAPVRVGERAPALVAPRLDGSVFDLAALRGKVVIINFWATWCSPCRAEMPQLDAFYRRYRARGLELLGVSVDDAQDRDAVVRVMKSFSYPAALAAAAKVNDFGAPIAVPMTWIIDAQGGVRGCSPETPPPCSRSSRRCCRCCHSHTSRTLPDTARPGAAGGRVY